MNEITVGIDAAGTWTIECDGQVLLRSADKQEIEQALDQMEQ